MFLAFAAAFLLNLLHPKFTHLLSEQQSDTIISSAGRLIQVLNDAAIDEAHMARSYPNFPSSLLDKHRLVQDGGNTVIQCTNSGVQHDPSARDSSVRIRSTLIRTWSAQKDRNHL